MTGARSIANNIAAARARIDAAAAKADRDPSGIRLVAVTKTVEPERIRAASAAGIVTFGENRAQELLDKQRALSDIDARWHFIGTLQRNKVNAVTGHVDLIHSVDSEALARAIATRAGTLGITQDVLLEVNLSGERTKHGFDPDQTAAAADRMRDLDGIIVRGLMTMAAEGDLEAADATFEAARRLRDDIGARIETIRELSMGMSADFEAAIAQGATLVRLGTALFGVR